MQLNKTYRSFGGVNEFMPNLYKEFIDVTTKKFDEPFIKKVKNKLSTVFA